MFNYYLTGRTALSKLGLTSSEFEEIGVRLREKYNSVRRSSYGYFSPVYYSLPKSYTDKIPKDYLYDHYKSYLDSLKVVEYTIPSDIRRAIDRSCTWSTTVPMYNDHSFLQALFFSHPNGTYISNDMLSENVKNDIKNIFKNILTIYRDDEECFSFSIKINDEDEEDVERAFRVVTAKDSNILLRETVKQSIYYHKQDIEKLSKDDFEYIMSGELQDIKSYFETLLDKMLEQEIKEKKKTINTLNMFAERYLTAYNDVIGSIEQKSIEILNMSRSKDSPLLDVLLKYKDKGIISNFKSKRTNNIDFSLNCELFNYNEIAAKKYTSDNSSLNLLIKDVFVDNKYSILLKTSLSLQISPYYALNRSTASSYSYSDLGIDYYKMKNDNYLSNPHILGYNCFGTNGPELTKLYKAGKYEEWMQALIACCANLNFNDYTVTSMMMNTLSNLITKKDDTIKLLKDNKTGEILTYAQYLKKEYEDYKKL